MITGEDLAHGWPGAKWNWPVEGQYNELEWFGPGDKPTEAEIEEAAAARAAQPAPYRLYKSVFIRRLTSAEAGVLEQVLAAADPKLRLMFQSVEYFVSDDPLFAELQAAVSAAISPGRADELLASEA